MYAISASLDTDEPIMLLNQQIGFDKENPGDAYIDGALFQNELFELDGKGYKAIKININSPGGNVVEGYNICNAILKTKTPVDTYNGGIAASMAATIFMMGRKRIMADYAAMMIHNPFGGSDNKMLKAMQKSLVTMICAKCSISEEEVSKMMDKETWLTASDCFAKGFCTDIEVTSESNIKRMPKVSALAMWKEATIIQNSLNSNVMAEVTATQATSKAIGTSLIAAYLDLNVDATENAVLTAVKQKVNTEIVARTKAEEEMDSMKDALAKATKKFEQDKKDFEDRIAAYEAKEKVEAEAKAKLEKETAAAKLEATRVSAKAIIEPYVLSKRVKADQVDKLVEMAIKTSVDDVKALLGELPANAAMPANAHVVVSTDATNHVVDPTKEGASAIHMMAKIKAAQNVRNKANAAY